MDPFLLSSIITEVLPKILYFFLHVTGAGSFPKALNSKEESKLIERMQNGDGDARSKLIEHNLRLVAHVAKKYNNSTVEQDDLISIGTIGLIKGISSFDPDKGIRLATYAARCIDNEILMYFRSIKKTSQDVYINDPIDTDKDGNTLTLIDVISDNCDIIDDIDLKMQIEKLGIYIDESLTDREKTIIFMRYGLTGHQEMTQRDVAQKLGISRSYVSRIEKKALQKLKYRFDKSGSTLLKH